MKEITAEIQAIAESYKYHKPPDYLIKVQEMIGQLLRLINDFFNHLNIKIPGLANTKIEAGIMQIILYAAGMVGAVIIIWLVWSRLTSLTTQSQLARKKAHKTSKLLDARGWREEAEKFAQCADWRSACRALYLSLLQLLHERGICEFAPARSNYEYWYALAKFPILQGKFRQLVNPVEMVWFGNQAAEAGDYQSCLTALADMEKEVDRVAPEVESTLEPAS